MGALSGFHSNAPMFLEKLRNAYLIVPEGD